MRDAEIALRAIATAAEGADALIFAGDMAKGPRPGPLAYRIFIDAFRKVSQTVPVFLVQGNHDHAQGAGSCLTILSRSLARREPLALGAITRPCVKVIADTVQFAFLPWSPPSRLFEKAPNDPAALSRLASATLHDVAAGLADQLVPDLPSVLVAHWIGEGSLYKVPSVLAPGEPILDADRLEALGFDLCLFAHYHVQHQLAPRSYYIGPPMRATFMDADVEPGFVVVEDGVLKRVALPDRPLVTVDLDNAFVAKLDGAVVRLRYTTTPEQAREKAEGAAAAVDQLYTAGALKVIGPEVTVITPERELRSDLTVDVDVMTALERWLVSAEVPEGLHDAVRAEAKELVGG
jgi:DNA repair exonuclease SbcCD nuclease subunit